MATTVSLGVAVSGCGGLSSTSAPPSAALTTIPVATATPAVAPSSSTLQTPAPTSAPASPAPVGKTDAAVRVLAGMSLAQRVGQLVMVGATATGATGSTLSAIGDYHVGNVILTGRSSLGTVPTSRVSARLRARSTAAATAGVGLFVATDQEGGQVQVLSGPGFSAIPSALTQGGWAASTLRARAATWGGQLKAAGVNVNLAPVADTVPQASAFSNRPIGFYRREFGYSTAVVGPHAAAFIQAMRASGVAATPKHFPGLGRVVANTDTTSGVTDSVTTRTSSYLGPFREAIAAGAPFVMMSSAIYSKIDAGNPACFSRTMITGLLRGDLGFRGVVISDDFGSARQVARWSPGSRATQFIAAGGDIVLTVDPRLAPAMVAALVAKANSSASFRTQVDNAALRVLRAKAAAHLLPAR